MTANVLVVDDLEPNIKLLEAKLLSEYYTVFTANNGFKAIEILANNKIDVILLDVMMPGIDGFETCKRIKANPETTHIPVVMVTALSDIEDRVKGLQAGADEFLTKPINDMALFARVKSLSRMKTVIDELKLRNQTNAELGASEIELSDNFTDSQIVLINDDIVQAKNITKMLQDITEQIRVMTDMAQLDSLAEDTPDLIIISCQLENNDPLRVAVMLRSKEALRHTSLMMLAEEENVPMVIKGMDLGVNDYFIYPVDESELLARVKTQLRRKKYQDNLRTELEQSFNLSIKDGLTGVFNRRYFDIHIQQMIKKSVETNRPLSLMMFDIDHFKQVNDTYGHQAGDEILRGFSNILKDFFRVTDLIARYGGEEFCVLLNSTPAEDANEVADRVRATVEMTPFKIPAQAEPLQKTVSIGVGQYEAGESAADFISKTDKALYEAKETGRNKVVLAPIK
jgi:two-component system cell cycle response regulator